MATGDISKRIARVEAEVGLGEASAIKWTPNPGPQTLAYTSTADVIGYGGAAGSGKSALAVGKALTQHKKVLIMRREATQLVGIIDEVKALVGNTEGYNGSDRTWRMPSRQIEFGSAPNLGDEARYQGRAHDLLVFDEAAHFAESQIRYLMGWLRSTDPGQRCQAVLTLNPPQNAEGRWVLD